MLSSRLSNWTAGNVHLDTWYRVKNKRLDVPQSLTSRTLHRCWPSPVERSLILSPTKPMVIFYSLRDLEAFRQLHSQRRFGSCEKEKIFQRYRESFRFAGHPVRGPSIYRLSYHDPWYKTGANRYAATESVRDWFRENRQRARCNSGCRAKRMEECFNVL
jgi:hypothetical protein